MFLNIRHTVCNLMVDTVSIIQTVVNKGHWQVFHNVTSAAVIHL